MDFIFKSIEVLPNEILQRILSELSDHERQQVALLNKHFYEQVCEVEKFKKIMKLTRNTVSVIHR